MYYIYVNIYMQSIAWMTFNIYEPYFGKVSKNYSTKGDKRSLIRLAQQNKAIMWLKQYNFCRSSETTLCALHHVKQQIYYMSL